MQEKVPDIVYTIATGFGAGVMLVVKKYGWDVWMAKRELTRKLKREGEEVEGADPLDHDPFGKRNIALDAVQRELQHQLADARVREASLIAQNADLKPKADALVTQQTEVERLRVLKASLEQRVAEQEERIKEFESGAIYSRLEREIRQLKERLAGMPTPLMPPAELVDAIEVDDTRTVPVAAAEKRPPPLRVPALPPFRMPDADTPRPQGLPTRPRKT